MTQKMSRQNTILSDFRRTKSVSLILIVGMLPLLAGGYCMYILFAHLPVVLLKEIKCNGLCLLVILFSFLYASTQFLNGHNYTPSALIFDLLFPFIMFQTGQYIVRKQNCPESALLLLILMAAALAIPAIFQNISDAAISGELINARRIIFNDSGDITRSATGYGMMLAIMNGSIGLLLVSTHNRFDARLKIMLVCLSVAALFSTIHLLNRTGLVLGLVSLIAIALLPPHTFKKNMYVLFVLLLSFGIAANFLQGSDFLLDAMKFYEERDMGSGTTASYGGRTERWTAGLLQLFTQPLGNDKGVFLDGHYTYAHNMWIDAGIHGGLLCFIILLVIGVFFILNVYRSYKSKYLTSFEKDLLVLFSLSMFLQLNTEPVIEGVPQFFWYFIFFTSVIVSLNTKYREREYHLKQ